MLASTERVRFLVKCLLLLPLIVFAVGCGGSEGSVSGKITYKGKAVTGGEIRFHPESKSGNFATEIKSDGSYSVSKVPPGPAKITITTFGTAPPTGNMGGRGMGGRGRGDNKAMEGMKKKAEMIKSKKEMEGKADEAPTERVAVPEKYSDPEKTDLKVDVKGGRQTHDINLD
ncbi:MAG TPA: hypothetical protein VH592_11840 [Gemmataceae bacterium]|jgi:hypothetical protein